MAKGKRPHVEKNAKNGKKTDLIADKDTEIGEKQNGDEAVEDSDDGDTSDSSVYSGLGSDEDESDSGKSLSEALIFASTNQQYDNRLFIEYKFNT